MHRYRMPAIFLDRDGTINLDCGYVSTIKTFIFINGVIDAMYKLIKMGFSLILVTNQSGIARGIFSVDQFMTLTRWMERTLAKNNVRLDGIYFCPHNPPNLVRVSYQLCNCRKPKPGMLLAAQKKFNINMSASYMIGDTIADMQAAKSAGVGKKILVRSGKKLPKEYNHNADWVLDSLKDLPQYIQSKHLK
ncbi:D-glycero-beta-D-manno-heptose-1,7-bisphosphate 7-phosphatase [Candidatus Erwinia haradaeae]|uniref:D,D-heptose 1,7-bisphosphate phosphatase n=1 Tax=Candidatus Erwinia haradaeae TaxID=1922217 RepID=A0A451DJ81_9GAMM|nr:D-glycero-beta-D-manno-heptose 1,7-bisphosphate 7-phosphatase [Candidatus Erwinia haradaeae]VFP86751.1 D-glycero-beta-D-manno-heptose-1,7-bisphosphate 7-phosphatase [Candidatus Erwinia haradaeae]